MAGIAFVSLIIASWVVDQTGFEDADQTAEVIVRDLANRVGGIETSIAHGRVGCYRWVLVRGVSPLTAYCAWTISGSLGRIRRRSGDGDSVPGRKRDQVGHDNGRLTRG